MTIKRFGVQLAASGMVIVLGALGVSHAQRESKSSDIDQWELESPPAMGPPPPIAADPSITPFPDRADNGRLQGSPSGPSSAAMPTTASTDMADFGPRQQPGNAVGIRQVNHEESFALPQTSYVDGSDQEAALASTSAGPASGGFALPAWSAGLANVGIASDAQNTAAAPPADDPQNAPAYGFSASVPAEDPVGDQPPSLQADAVTLGGTSMAGISVPSAGSTAQADASTMPTLQFESGPADSGPVNALRDFDSAPEPTAIAVATADSRADIASNPIADNQYEDSVAGPPSQGVAMPNAFAAQPTYVPTESYADQAQQNVAANNRESGFGAGFGSPQPAAAPIAQIASTSSVLPKMADSESLQELVLNEPGDRRLDGMQSPSVVIHKRAPEQVKVGKVATFVIQVRNVGSVEALDVQVHDRVPAGMRLVDSAPQPQMQGDLMLWQLGALEPGGERTISLQLVPEAEGELGSVARVTFEAAASVRTFSTRPALKITQRAPEQVLIGQQLEIELEVSNPGTGVATGVVLQADVPDGLEHPKGRELDNLIGTLAPGEKRRQVLRLRAVAPGNVLNQVRLVGDDELTATDAVNIEVVAPQLAIELEGPARRFLERQATYQINIANIGSAEASNVEIVAYLDRGFTFVGTEFQGQYDASRHAVYWSLAELPVEARGAVPLTLLPIEQGERAIRLEARGDLNLVARHEKKVSVDALAELTFSITDDADPIEVGSVATYEIRLINRGARADADVKLQLQLPPGLELVSSESDASTDGRGLVIFAPQAAMPPRSETVHRVRVKGTSPGAHVVRATVSSREAPVSVTKEESTTVYADQ